MEEFQITMSNLSNAGAGGVGGAGGGQAGAGHAEQAPTARFHEDKTQGENQKGRDDET